MKENRGSVLSLVDYKKTATFLASSGNKTIGLLGGEPTLNPEFLEIVDWSVSQGLQVIVYSNLIARPQIVAGLKGYRPDQVNIIVNVYRDKKEDLAKIGPNLRDLSHLIKLTLAVDRPQFEWRFLVDLIEEFNLIRKLRMKVALPVLGGRNGYLALQDYKEAGNNIADLCEEAGRKQIHAEFGCGFIKCMFSEQQLARLDELGHSASFTCRPIVDVDSKGKASHCLPLSNLPNFRIEDFESVSDLVGEFHHQTVAFRKAGVMAACHTCAYLKDGSCAGGCLGMTMGTFNKEVPKLARPHLASRQGIGQLKRDGAHIDEVGLF